MEQITTLSDCRAAFAAAAVAARALPGLLWQTAGADLGALLAEVDAVAAGTEACRLAVTGEAVDRGEVAGSQFATTAAWVAEHAPSLRAGGAGRLAAAVEAFAKPANGPIREAVLTTRLPVGTGMVVVSELDRLNLNPPMGWVAERVVA